MMTVADDPALHLVAQAKAGAEGAFDALIRPLLAPAHRLAFAMLRDHHAAEDAVQEATFKAWRSFAQVREAANLRAWYLAIVANECRRATRGRWWQVLRLPELPPASGPGPEDTVTRRVDLLDAFARLGFEQRLTLCLAYYLDLPYEEIAHLLKVREGTVLLNAFERRATREQRAGGWWRTGAAVAAAVVLAILAVAALTLPSTLRMLRSAPPVPAGPPPGPAPTFIYGSPGGSSPVRVDWSGHVVGPVSIPPGSRISRTSPDGTLMLTTRRTR